MDIKNLKDFNKIKVYLEDIQTNISNEFSKLSSINKENLISCFDKYFIDYLKKNYFKFEGRVSRYQFWMFILFIILIFFSLKLISILLPFSEILIFFVMVSLFCLVLLPIIGLAVRRLHDLDLQGSWCLFAVLSLFPKIGFIFAFIVLFVLAIPGDKGDNNYGKVVIR